MKRGLIFLILILLLVISGCTQLPQFPSFLSTGKTITAGRGIEIKFLDNQPPTEEIIADIPFYVSFDITNKGLVDVSGTVSVSDSPIDQLSAIQGKEQNSFYLDASVEQENKFIPNKETIRFGPFTYKSEKVYKGMTTDIITEIGLDYRMDINSQICIKSMDSTITGCPNKETITEAKLGKETSSSPVSISRIEKSVTPLPDGKILLLLELYIKNFGNGEVANSELTNFNINLLGADLFNCNFIKGQALKLYEGERIINCNAEINLDSQFRQEQIQISYDYSYRITNTLGSIRITKLES